MEVVCKGCMVCEHCIRRGGLIASEKWTVRQGSGSSAVQYIPSLAMMMRRSLELTVWVLTSGSAQK